MPTQFYNLGIYQPIKKTSSYFHESNILSKETKVNNALEKSDDSKNYAEN